MSTNKRKLGVGRSEAEPADRALVHSVQNGGCRWDCTWLLAARKCPQVQPEPIHTAGSRPEPTVKSRGQHRN